MKFYTVIFYTAWYGQTNPKPSTAQCTGNFNIQKQCFFYKNLYSSWMEMKVHYPAGPFLMVILPHSVWLKILRSFSPYTKIPFLKIETNCILFNIGHFGVVTGGGTGDRQESHVTCLSSYLLVERSHGQIWPTTASSPTSSPFWTLPYSFAHYLKPHLRFVMMGKHESWTSFVLFPLSAILPHNYGDFATVSGVGSLDQERKDRRWKHWLSWPGTVTVLVINLSCPNS